MLTFLPLDNHINAQPYEIPKLDICLIEGEIK